MTMHGFALNVNPDLSYFDHIVPCGMPDASVTSITDQGIRLDVLDVSNILTNHFAHVLDFSLTHTTLSALTAQNLPVASAAQGRL